MAEDAKRPLTPKQAAFVREYLIDLNATQAAIRAGYNPKTAHSMGHENLSKPEIATELQKHMEARGERTKVTADRVLLEIERLAMYDPKDLTNVSCPKDIAELPEDVRRAVIGWSWDKNGNFTVKMAKEKALEMMGRHHKIFTDKTEVHVTGLADLLASIDGSALKIAKDGNEE